MVETGAKSETERKEAWLKELANFIVEGNLNTWAADAGKLPDEDGFKRHGYARGPWRLEDRFTGYFKAPGITTVYYKDRPSWVIAYGGRGQADGFEDLTKETFNFLKSALKRVTVELPYRGPNQYKEGEWVYHFEMVGNIEEFTATETVVKMSKGLVFGQTLFGGLVVHKDENRKPIYPWNL